MNVLFIQKIKGQRGLYSDILKCILKRKEEKVVMRGIS